MPKFLRDRDRGGDAWSGVDRESLAAGIDAWDPLPERGVPFSDVTDEIGRLVLEHSILPSNPRVVAHLHSPTMLSAALMELTIGATNQSMDSYDQAPAATLVEDRLVRRIAELCGMPATASGVMTAGGTASNLLGLTLARESAARARGLDVAAVGLGPEARRWRILASEAAHFSVRRAAMLLGLGRRAVVGIATNERGEIDSDALDETLARIAAEGGDVIALVGTAGTTDLGAIDPLPLLADRARELRAWFHVDAGVGGAFVVSNELAPRVAGLERADSVTIDLHKLWWQPISASTLLVGDEASFGLIHEHSEYLDRAEDEETGVLNLVSRSLDTSRRFDALKVFASLRNTGRIELAMMVEYVVEMAVVVAEIIDRRPEFELLAEPSTVMIVFRWVGDGSHTAAELDRINTDVQRRLFESGRAVIGRTTYRGAVALKFTLVNPTLRFDDLDDLLDLIAAEAGSVVRGAR